MPVTPEREAVGNRSEEPLFPREMVWLYPLAPLVFSGIMMRDLLASSQQGVGKAIVATYVPFVALTVFFHLSYVFVMPKLLARIRGAIAKVGTHALFIVVGSVVVGELIRPVHNRILGVEIEAISFAVTTVLISVVMIVPALLVQVFRNRTEAVSRIAASERQAALRAQLAALQARTNPHFFFNSINTVASLISDNPDLAERTLERLAELFRYALDAGRLTSVSLGREFEIVSDYLEIERARFGKNLSAHLSLDPELSGFEVPPLLLQPLVENAVLHGLGERKKGLIDVRASREDGNLVIEVQDDGPGPGASSHLGSQTSIRELAQRLRLLFGDGAKVLLQSAAGGGCLVRVVIPMEAR